MDDDAEKNASVVQSYLAADKTVSSRMFWREKRHKDFVEANLPVICPDLPEINGELILIAHKTRIPKKYGFTLLAGSFRIVGLDVNPGSSHFNRRTLTSVSSTHWQFFPGMDAEADGRSMEHREWLAEFCKRTNINLSSPYRAPAHNPVQLDLL